MKMSNILFAHKSEKVNLMLTEPVTTGQIGISGLNLSKARPPKAAKVAKISGVAKVIELLLTSKTNALTNKEEGICYCEVINSGNVKSYFFNSKQNTLSFYNNSGKPFNPTSYDNLCPIFFWAINNDNFPETKAVFNDLIETQNITQFVDTPKLFLLCDAFYYEFINAFSDEIDTNEMGSIDSLQIQQAINTKHLKSFIKKVDALPPFQNVKYVDLTEDNEIDVSNDDYDKCKDGTYDVPYNWNNSQYDNIPNKDKLNTFVPNQTFFNVLNLIRSETNSVLDNLDRGLIGAEAIGDNYVNLILTGKPGTGKTSVAQAVAAALGMPIRTVTISKGTEEDTFQGVTKVVNGQFQFCETPFLDAFKNGGIVVLEEFNLADPSIIMGSLGQAIEYPFVLMEDGFREVKRHPLCIVIATMNTGTQGSREPSEAFTSRAPGTFILDDPTQSDFINILASKGYKKSDCEKVYNAYSKVLNYLENSGAGDDIALSVTLRHCLGALKFMNIGMPIKNAIQNTIVGTIAIKDRIVASDVYSSVIEPMRL